MTVGRLIELLKEEDPTNIVLMKEDDNATIYFHIIKVETLEPAYTTLEIGAEEQVGDEEEEDVEEEDEDEDE